MDTGWLSGVNRVHGASILVTVIGPHRDGTERMWLPGGCSILIWGRSTIRLTVSCIGSSIDRVDDDTGDAISHAPSSPGEARFAMRLPFAELSTEEPKHVPNGRPGVGKPHKQHRGRYVMPPTCSRMISYAFGSIIGL